MWRASLLVHGRSNQQLKSLQARALTIELEVPTDTERVALHQTDYSQYTQHLQNTKGAKVNKPKTYPHILQTKITRMRLNKEDLTRVRKNP